MEPTHRKLTTHQKAVLIQVLRTFPEQRVGIWYSAAASDGRAYALEFVSIFKAIGWAVEGPEGGEILGEASSGLALLVSEGNELPACAEALRDALRIYGIEMGVQTEDGRDFGAGGFGLWIGMPGET